MILSPLWRLLCWLAILGAYLPKAERATSLLPSVCFALHRRYLTVIAWGSAAARLFYKPRRLKMRAPHVKQHTFSETQRNTRSRLSQFILVPSQHQAATLRPFYYLDFCFRRDAAISIVRLKQHPLSSAYATCPTSGRSRLSTQHSHCDLIWHASILAVLVVLHKAIVS